eukprot:TRINITY_DN1277_c0_g1_i1.p1 TRINITY_DN1277_c0_g1~~TRINITY_DN1277_c0_g1_i1.p1  ORF type:complete len:105 (-),score=17.30 TRINITY_DN1277_c0_g1_i1:22-336(-)
MMGERCMESFDKPEHCDVWGGLNCAVPCSMRHTCEYCLMDGMCAFSTDDQTCTGIESRQETSLIESEQCPKSEQEQPLIPIMRDVNGASTLVASAIVLVFAFVF